MLIISLTAGSSFSQNCFFSPCFDNDCGDLNVGFTPLGGPQFCEGQTITLTNTSAAGFDFFVVDWRDGNVDTAYNYDPFQHVYNIPDSLVCVGPPIRPFSLCFKGQKECDDGISCQSGTYDFGIIVRPEASFETNTQICVNTEFTLNNTSCNATNYFWDFGNGMTSTETNPTILIEEAGVYTILLTATNQCGVDIFSAAVQVVDPPIADFSAIADPQSACAPVLLTLNNQSENSSSHSWTITPNSPGLWELADTNKTLNSPNIEVFFYQGEEYEITLTALNACGSDQFSQTVEIFEDIGLVIDPPDPFCEATTLTASDLGFAISGSVESIEWTFINGSIPSAMGADFPPVTFSESGEIFLNIDGNCRDTLIAFPITIIEGEITFGNNPEEICGSSSSIQLIAEPPGGTWSGPGIIDEGEGIFDPSGLQGGQSYTLTYSFEISPCEISDEIEILVIESESGTFDPPLLCEDSGEVSLTAIPTGGVWSGPGITDPQNGIFDPQVSGAGVFEINYAFIDTNDCEVLLVEELMVEEIPVLSLLDSLQLCVENLDEDLPILTYLTVHPSGGQLSWSGPGIVNTNGTFNSGVSGIGPGFYTLMVRYERNDCLVEDSVIVELIEKPVLEVAFSDTLLCVVSGSLQLSVNPSGGIWSGPGVDSQTGEIDLELAGSGEHQYQYVYQGGSSCELSTWINVELLDPGLDLELGEDEEICEGAAFFTLSPAHPTGGRWTGPGIINNETGEIDLSFLNPGQTYEYQYCIESSLVDNCVACAIREFTLNPEPVAAFVVDEFACAGDPFNPVNNSTGGQSYFWDFGDGNSSTQRNPTHVYSNSGNYTVSLEVSSPEGCSQAYSLDLLVVEAPIADFEIPENEGCEPFDLELINLGSGYLPAFTWVIGNDSIDGENPGIIELYAGEADSIYNIQLIASNACGYDLVESTVRVFPMPLAEFGLSEPFGCSPFEVFFSNTSTGNPDEFFWDFGNGNTSIDLNPGSQIYTVDSTFLDFTIELIAENHCGRDTHQREIRVFPPNVTAFIEMPAVEACAPHQLQPASFSTPGAHLNWEVLFDGEVIAGSNERFPQFSLEEAGEYTIVLKASNCGVHSDTTLFRLLESPELEFDHQKEVCLDDQVFFSNQSINGTSPLWDFGDGNQSNQISPVHVYEEPGIYLISLFMEHPETACPVQLEKEIRVLERPEPDFIISGDMGCPPLEVSFINQSSGEVPMNFRWNFGDGGFESAQTNPVYVYSNSGEFNVSLLAAYEDFCSDSLFLEKAVKIYVRPMADFDYIADVNSDILGDIEFFNLSERADSYFWDFGDGNNSNDINPIHEYDVNRPVKVELVAYNYNNGEYLCADSISKLVEPQWITTFFAPNAMAPEYGTDDVRFFKPTGSGIAEYEISIYSPWGEQVWYSTMLDDHAPADYWDGTFKGSFVPQGAYVWVANITFVNGVRKVERGTVTVLR